MFYDEQLNLNKFFTFLERIFKKNKKFLSVFRRLEKRVSSLEIDNFHSLSDRRECEVTKNFKPDMIMHSEYFIIMPIISAVQSGYTQ